MSGVSYEQLMKPVQIMKLVRRLSQTSAFFQTLMGMGVGSAPSMVVPAGLRTFGYDIYASTRTTARATSPMTPPNRIGRKPIGQQSATLVRFHDSMPIYDEQVFGGRRIGGRLSEVDATGQSYIRLQVEHLMRTFFNAREFMISRMLRGGFSLVPEEGDSYKLSELNDTATSGTIQVDYGLPSENVGDLGGIIASGEGWDTASAPILEHLMNLSKRMARTSGFYPKHIILNSSTVTPLFENSTLQNIRGSAFRVFDEFTQREINPADANSSAVYRVVFGALPMWQFHVINDGLVTEEVVPNEANQSSVANFKLFVPDGKAIIIPEPSRVWAGMAAGTEPVRERVDQNGLRMVQGFGLWRTPEIDPPRFEVKALDNAVPVLFMPKVVHFADVWEPYTSSEV